MTRSLSMANSIPKVKSWDGPRTAATWWSPFGKKKKEKITKLPIKRSNLVQSWLSPHSKFKQLVELTMGAFSGLASTVVIHLFFSSKNHILQVLVFNLFFFLVDFKYPCQVKASPNYYYSAVKKKKSLTLFFFFFFFFWQVTNLYCKKGTPPPFIRADTNKTKYLLLFFFLFFFAEHKPSHSRRRLDFGSGFRGTSGGDAEIIFQGPIFFFFFFFLLNRLRSWALPLGLEIPLLLAAIWTTRRVEFKLTLLLVFHLILKCYTY